MLTSILFLCQKKETKKGHRAKARQAHTGQPQNRFSHPDSSGPKPPISTLHDSLKNSRFCRAPCVDSHARKDSGNFRRDRPSRKWWGDCAGVARESSLFEPKRVALGEFRGFTAMCVAESAANFLDSLDFLVLLYQDKRTKKMANRQRNLIEILILTTLL